MHPPIHLPCRLRLRLFRSIRRWTPCRLYHRLALQRSAASQVLGRIVHVRKDLREHPQVLQLRRALLRREREGRYRHRRFMTGGRPKVGSSQRGMRSWVCRWRVQRLLTCGCGYWCSCWQFGRRGRIVRFSRRERPGELGWGCLRVTDSEGGRESSFGAGKKSMETCTRGRTTGLSRGFDGV